MNGSNEITNQVASEVQKQQDSLGQSVTDVGGGVAQVGGEIAVDVAAEGVLDTVGEVAGDLIGGIFDAF